MKRFLVEKSAARKDSEMNAMQMSKKDIVNEQSADSDSEREHDDICVDDRRVQEHVDNTQRDENNKSFFRPFEEECVRD